MVDARHHGFPAGSLVIYNMRSKKFSVQDDKIIKFGIDSELQSEINEIVWCVLSQAAATKGPTMKTIKTKIYYTFFSSVVICRMV